MIDINSISQAEVQAMSNSEIIELAEKNSATLEELCENFFFLLWLKMPELQAKYPDEGKKIREDGRKLAKALEVVFSSGLSKEEILSKLMGI